MYNYPDFKYKKIFLLKAKKAENNQRILSLFGFLEYKQDSKILDHLIYLARRFICPITIFRELIAYLATRKIIIPSYTVMQDLITFATSVEEKRLSNTIEQKLPKELNLLLERMLTHEKISGLNSFKKFPKNFKYKALKEEVDKGKAFKEIYGFAKEFLQQLDISAYNIKYYAMVAEEYNIAQLRKLKFTVAKLYLLCYVHHRYQQIDDNLIICYNHYADKFNKGLVRGYLQKWQSEIL